MIRQPGSLGQDFELMSENDPAEHIIFIDRTRSSTTSLGGIELALKIRRIDLVWS
jgi:hypothetical protein